MTEQTLAQLSDLLFVVAIVVYVFAMVGFAADLARSTQRRSDAKLAERMGAAPARELVGAGASADAAGLGSGRSVPVSPADGASAQEGLPFADAARSTRGADGSAVSRAGSFAMAMMGVGVVFHLMGVVARGVATQRVPWSNMYEFAMTGSAVVITAMLVILVRRKDLRVLGTFIVVPMLILMLIAQRMWYVPAAALPPSLQNSHWLVIHVSVAIVATALFTIGAVVSVLQLLRARLERRQAAGEPTGTNAVTRSVDSILLRLPIAKDLEALAFRIHAVAFVLWTFTLIFGSIWASTAWGRYWGWDPKEVWTFVIWVVYAAYLHARATVGFRGNGAAWFALAGFACVIFNFTIVNTVINGLHSYSGLT